MHDGGLLRTGRRRAHADPRGTGTLGRGHDARPSARRAWPHGRSTAITAIPTFVPARLTVDLFKSPGMKETRVSTSLVRAGGRVRVADAFIQVGGVDVARGTALYLRKGEAPVDDAPLTRRVGLDDPRAGRRPVRHAVRGPADRRHGLRRGRAPSHVAARAPPAGHRRGAHALHPGRGRRRLREPARELGVAKASSTSTRTCALYIARLPEGEWIGVEYADRVAADGVSVAHCRLHDELGPIGSSEVCAVLNPRMPRFEEPSPEPGQIQRGAGRQRCRSTPRAHRPRLRPMSHARSAACATLQRRRRRRSRPIVHVSGSCRSRRARRRGSRRGCPTWWSPRR